MNAAGLRSSNAPTGIDFTRMWICTRCCGLAGPWTYVKDSAAVYQERCRCERSAQPDGERWPRFDFNTVAELCKVCGRECLQSGSKWSVWFCDECKEYVRQLHAVAGRYLIPIGRHSMMSGFGVESGSTAMGLPSDWPFDQELIEKFLKRWHSVSDRMRALDYWSRFIVKDNLIGMDLSNCESVKLSQYLRVAAKLPQTKKEAFLEMCKFLQLRTSEVRSGSAAV